MPASLRFAFRALLRSPGFSLLAIVILTLGIGATTAMFSITRTVLVKPLAYRDPQQLITIMFRIPQFSKQLSTIPVNGQHYELWRDHARTLAGIALVGPSAHLLSGRGETVQVSGVRVTSNFFRLLGVQPVLGRSFAKGEDQAGRDKIAVVSDHFWRDKLGGRADVIGQKIRFDGEPYEVIGVMPAKFPFPRVRQLSDLAQLPERTDYWVPLALDKNDLQSPLGNMNYIPIARLKQGVTPAAALSDMRALEKVIAKRFEEPIEVDPIVRPLQQAMAREVRLPLLILMGAVGSVLLIVCINLMNLMMVRATAQRREWAIRLAIGASLPDVLRGVLLESLLLAFAGGGLGVLFSMWLLQLVRFAAPLNLPRVDELAPDGWALVFSLLLAMGSAVLFGLWPAWRAAQTDPQEALQSASRGSSEGRKEHRAGKALVAVEVALSTILLLSAALLVRSFAATMQVSPGVRVEQILTVRINLPPEKYTKDSDVHSFYQRLESQVRSLPGVGAAGLVSGLPLTGEDNNNPATAGDRAAPPLVQWQMTNSRSASSEYFQAAGIPLKEGKVFQRGNADATSVMISDNLAARLWPKENAVGRPVRIYGNKLYTVKGVVGSVHAASLTQTPTMMIYFPDWQSSDRDMSLVVRTEDEPSSLASVIRRSVSRLEPEAATPTIQTMRQVVAESVAQQRFEVMLLVAFALAALTLALLGIYGVLAFDTTRRTSEIGIRMALGARPTQILQATLQNGMIPVAFGIGVGLAISAAFARVLQSLLFQVKALDPIIYLAITVLLLAAACLACLLPARRAAQMNPVQALRNE